MPAPADEDLASLVRLLEGVGIHDFALTGGVAFGVWVEPRATRDIDLCGELPPASLLPLLALHDGMRVGASEIPDVVRFRSGDWDADLFVAKSEDDRECLRRAVSTEIGGVRIRVVTAEDLVLHKMRKLRSDRRRLLQDIADLRALLDRRGSTLDWAYLRGRLPPDEVTLLESVRDLPQEELLERLRS